MKRLLFKVLYSVAVIVFCLSFLGVSACTRSSEQLTDDEQARTIQILIAQRAELEAVLDGERSKNAALQRDNADMDSAIQELRRENAALRRENEELRARMPR